MARRATARYIKSERPYTIADAAEVTLVSIATVRQWVREGLPIFKAEKPFLIVGADLKEFLDVRSSSRKSKLAPDEFYCLHCRCGRRAFGGLADFTPKTPATGVLSALCVQCEGEMHRFVSTQKLDRLRQFLDIEERQAAKPSR